MSYLPSASCEGALMMFGALAAFVIVQNREAGAALEWTAPKSWQWMWFLRGEEIMIEKMEECLEVHFRGFRKELSLANI